MHDEVLGRIVPPEAGELFLTGEAVLPIILLHVCLHDGKWYGR